MNPWRWVDPRVRKVSLSDVRAYFEGRGWRLVSNPNPDFLRFEEGVKGTGEPFYQIVPASDESDDYRQRIGELITTLSELEDRHPVEVLDDMLQHHKLTTGKGRQRAPRRTTSPK